MALVGTLTTFSPLTLAKSSEVNANFSALKAGVNTAVFTDTACTITVTHTFNASQTFSAGLAAAAAVTISAGGLSVTGGGVSVSAGGVSVTGGGLSVTGTTTLTGATTLAGGIVTIGAPATTSGASSGDLVLAYASTLRSANSAGGSTLPLIRAATNGVADVVQLAPGSAPVSFGDVYANGAAAGEAVIGNGKFLQSVTPAGTATAFLIGMDANSVVCLAGATGLNAGSLMRVSYFTNPVIPAAAAARDGCLGIDATNNRLFFYSNGVRRYIAATGTF